MTEEERQQRLVQLNAELAGLVQERVERKQRKERTVAYADLSARIERLSNRIRYLEHPERQRERNRNYRARRRAQGHHLVAAPPPFPTEQQQAAVAVQPVDAPLPVRREGVTSPVQWDIVPVEAQPIAPIMLPSVPGMQQDAAQEPLLTGMKTIYYGDVTHSMAV